MGLPIYLPVLDLTRSRTSLSVSMCRVLAMPCHAILTMPWLQSVSMITMHNHSFCRAKRARFNPEVPCRALADTFCRPRVPGSHPLYSCGNLTYDEKEVAVHVLRRVSVLSCFAHSVLHWPGLTYAVLSFVSKPRSTIHDRAGERMGSPAVWPR